MVVGGIRNNKGKSVHVYDYIKLKLAKEEDLWWYNVQIAVFHSLIIAY